MAHFAKLSEANVVLSVEHLNDEDCLDSDGKESEAVGIAHQSAVHGWNLWKQCSYNTVTGIYYQQNEDGTMTEASDQSKAFRKNYPGMGDTYDPTRDAFIKARPDGMNSWVLNESKCIYEPPIANPGSVGDNEMSQWNESAVRWEKGTYSVDSDGNGSFDGKMTEYWDPNTSSWKSI
tara:strand:- start:780 stop:1310 length:531 start_codon:yes stop_codon:yes gene_type:complete